MTNNLPDKTIIKQRFARSLATYNDNAVIQQDIAARLLDELISAAGNRYDNILEVGCGSGLLTRMLSSKVEYGNLLLNDLVDQCSQLAS